MSRYNSPKPRYEEQTNQLRNAYQRGAEKVMRELDRLDVSNLSRQQSTAALAGISRTLKDLDAVGAKWVDENIPRAAREGVEKALITLGEAKDAIEARKVASFNRMNRAAIDAAILDTQRSLLAVTQNIDRRTRAVVRNVTAESMRENMAAGINGRKTLRADILAKLQVELADAIDTGIIDAGGRRWKPGHYVDMLSRTKMAEIYDIANMNEGIMRGALYAVISSHGAIDACRFYEGTIMRLTAEAPGDYPTYDELKASQQIWHPNCRHTFSVIRNPDILPEEIREEAIAKDELAQQALATGERNPIIDEDFSSMTTGKILSI